MFSGLMIYIIFGIYGVICMVFPYIFIVFHIFINTICFDFLFMGFRGLGCNQSVATARTASFCLTPSGFQHYLVHCLASSSTVLDYPLIDAFLKHLNKPLRLTSKAT